MKRREEHVADIYMSDLCGLRVVNTLLADMLLSFVHVPYNPLKMWRGLGIEEFYYKTE